MKVIKFINLDDGTEYIREMEIIKEKTTTYTLSDSGSPMFLEWDADEDIWTYVNSASEE